jgi:hypothetical protein
MPFLPDNQTPGLAAGDRHADMQQLEAHENPLAKVFCGDYDYQRPYAWGKERAAELLDDLSAQRRTEGDPTNTRLLQDELSEWIRTRRHDLQTATTFGIRPDEVKNVYRSGGECKGFGRGR